MEEYYVSGVIQFTVKAKSYEEAYEKADRRAATIMNSSATVNINLEADATEKKLEFESEQL